MKPPGTWAQPAAGEQLEARWSGLWKQSEDLLSGFGFPNERPQGVLVSMEPHTGGQECERVGPDPRRARPARLVQLSSC